MQPTQSTAASSVQQGSSVQHAGTPVQQSTNPALQNDIDALKTLYQLSIDTRNFEIAQLVQRNNFFMVFQGVLLAGLMQASGGNPLPIVAFFVCLIGFLVSLLQTGMAAGAKFWQERWEYEVEEIEARLLKHLPIVSGKGQTFELFSKTIEESKKIVVGRMKPWSPSGWLIRCRFSVSRIPIWVGLACSLGWGGLLVHTFILPSFTSPPKLTNYTTGFPTPPKDITK